MKEKEVKQAKEVVVSGEVTIIINVEVLTTLEEEEEDTEMIEAQEEVHKKGAALLLLAEVEVEIQHIQKEQSLSNLRIEDLALVMARGTLFETLVEVVEDTVEKMKVMTKVTTNLLPIEEVEVTKAGVAGVMAIVKQTAKADVEVGIRAVEGEQTEIPTLKWEGLQQQKITQMSRILHPELTAKYLKMEQLQREIILKVEVQHRRWEMIRACHHYHLLNVTRAEHQ